LRHCIIKGLFMIRQGARAISAASVAGVVAAMVACGAAVRAGEVRYEAVDLGPCGVLAVPLAVNDSLVVVGSCLNESGISTAFRWSGGVMTSLTSMVDGFTLTDAWDVNESGMILVEGLEWAHLGVTRVLLLDENDQAMLLPVDEELNRPLPGQSSYGRLNDAGAAAYSTATCASREYGPAGGPVLFDGAVTIPLVQPDAECSYELGGIPLALNNAGDVLMLFSDTPGEGQSFGVRLASGAIVEPSSAGIEFAWSMNDLGDAAIVTTESFQGAIWNAHTDEVTIIPTPRGIGFRPYAIDNLGRVGGAAEILDMGVHLAALWDGVEFVELECAIPPGFALPLEEVTAMSQNGAIAGIGYTSQGQFRGFLLIPLADAYPSPDLNCDGAVEGADLGQLLSEWNRSGASDLDESGFVDGADLGALLAAWTG
jgi:hypothetical protein